MPASEATVPRESRALGAGLLTVVMWGSAFVGIRALAGTLSPGSIALGRLLAGLAVFAAVALWGGQRPPRSIRHVLLAAMYGVAWFGFYTIALSAGERELDAGTAVLIVNFGPILIAILAGVFLGESIGGRLLTGCAVALCGTALVGGSLADGASVGGSVAGLLLCLAATLGYAIGATVQRLALRSVAAAWVNLIGASAATVVCLPFAPGLIGELRTTDPGHWLWLAYLGLFPTAVGFSTWAYALARTTAARTAAVNYLVPVVAILLSWVLLAEVPRPLALVGGAICVGGVILARSKSPTGPAADVSSRDAEAT